MTEDFLLPAAFGVVPDLFLDVAFAGFCGAVTPLGSSFPRGPCGLICIFVSVLGVVDVDAVILGEGLVSDLGAALPLLDETGLGVSALTIGCVWDIFCDNDNFNFNFGCVGFALIAVDFTSDGGAAESSLLALPEVLSLSFKLGVFFSSEFALDAAVDGEISFLIMGDFFIPGTFVAFLSAFRFSRSTTLSISLAGFTIQFVCGRPVWYFLAFSKISIASLKNSSLVRYMPFSKFLETVDISNCRSQTSR